MMTNPELRARARAALKPILPVAMLAALCANLPSLINQVMTALSQQPLQQFLYRFSESDLRLYTPEQLLTDLAGAITPQMMTVALVGGLLSFLLTPVLSLGLYWFTLKLLRGEGCSVSDVLSRFPQFFKALGLQVMTFLRICLWAIPGAAVMFAGTFIFIQNATTSGLTLFMGTYFGGLVLMLVLMARCALQLSMAQIVMADKPETGVFASMRFSTDMTKGRLGLLLSLYLSIIGWMLLASFVQGMLEGISPVIGMTLGMAASLLVSVYMVTSVTAFYEAWKPGAARPEPVTEKAGGEDYLN